MLATVTEIFFFFSTVLLSVFGRKNLSDSTLRDSIFNVTLLMI